MKRAILALLGALCIAAPAAAKTLIVNYTGVSNANAQSFENGYSDLTGMLQRRGASFQTIELQATKTEWMRTGLQVWKAWNLASVDAEQFDCVVIFGFRVGGRSVQGSVPESLTITTKWPTVPVVFVGSPETPAGKWTGASTCSTGVKSLGVAYSAVRQSYVGYSVGTTNPWRASALNLWPTVITSSATGVTTRRVVAYNYSAVTPGPNPATSQLLRADPDSTGYTAAGNDSVLLWTQNMLSAASGGPAAATSPKPIIFVEPYGAGVAGHIGLLAMAMQMADSAAGGRVFDRAGNRPIKIGFGVTAGVGRGYYTKDLSANNTTHLQGGAFCQSDTCDTTNVLSGLDSLATLSGLKTTFFVDACSLAAYPSVKNWFSRAGKYHVGIQPIAGTGALAGAATAASSTYPADPFGRSRTRLAALPWGGVTPAADTLGNCTAASDTILTYCGIKWQQAIVSTYFPGLLDRSALPAFGDWSPAAFTRLGGGPGRDSVVYAIWRAGIRTIIIRPEHINTNPSVAFATSTPGAALVATTAVTDPYGYGPDPESIPVLAAVSGRSDLLNVATTTPERVIGRLKIVAERGQRNGPNISYTDAFHDIVDEWMQGTVQDRWYSAPIRYYYHSFFAHTPMLTISLGQLGGHGSANTPGRIGWWVIKHAANQIKAANDLGWVDGNGRRRAMFEWVYAEDLDP